MIADARPLSRLEAKRAEQTPQALARLVVVGLFIGLWFVLLVARIPMPLPFLLVLLAEVTFFVVYLRAVALLTSVRAVEMAQYVMLAAEIVFHTTIVYFLGGISWLGAFAYVFGLIFANTFLDIRRGLVYTLGASSAFLALIALEASGTVPHHAYLDQGALRYQDSRFVVTTAVCGFGVFFSIYLWVNWVGYQLRRERNGALRAQDDLLRARAQLQKSNEELERRVEARTAELQAANVALRESEEKLRAIIGGAPLVLFATDKDGIFTLSEGKGLEALGLKPGEVVGLSVFDVYRDVPEIGANIWIALGGQALTAIVDVGLLSFETHYEPLRDADGVVTGVIGVATDVTERRRAERLLRESEQRLRTVVSNAPVVLFALDAEGVFTLAEGRALDDLGIDPASIIGRSSEDVYRNAPDMAEATRRALAGEQAAALLETDRLALEARMGPIFGAGGQVLGVIGVATDVSERRRAERALRESEERFRKIFEEGPLGMAIVGPDFRLMRANAKLCDMLGYGEDELTSKTFLEITHPDDTEADAQLAQRVFAGEIPSYNIEKRYLKKDGSILWAALTASVIHDRATNALYGLGMVEDITERKRAEDALRESEERHRWLIESAPDAMVIVNAGGQIEMVNTQAERLFRYARGELIGQPVELLVPEALRTAHAHHRAGYHFEQRSMAEDRANLAGRRKDGSVFPAEISLSPLQTDGGMLVTAAIRDVTERKQAEVALLESETKFRTMAETVAAATFIFQGTKMCYVNSAAEELSGYTRDELLAMDFWDVIHPEFRDLVKERGLRRQLGEEVPPRYEVKLVTKDGEDKWVDFTAGMIDFEGRPAVLGTAFDITERKRVERALHDAASHDPLTGVLNRRAGMAALAERLERARTGSGRYATLVLDLDRFKTINDNYSHETGDSALLLFTSVMRGTVEDAGVICRLGGDEFEIGLDGARLEQALLHAERLQRALRRAQESDDVNCPPFTVSIGIACYPEDGEDVITLGRHADEAMYAAKAAGGNRYRAWRHIRSRAA